MTNNDCKLDLTLAGGPYGCVDGRSFAGEDSAAPSSSALRRDRSPAVDRHRDGSNQPLQTHTAVHIERLA